MYNSRKELSEKIITELNNEIPSAYIALRGSVSRNEDDDLSDIDIQIEDKKLTDRQIANLVIYVMLNKFDVILYDWAKGFLPKECVITFFINDMPLHSFVELSIIVNPMNRELDPNEIEQKAPGHLLKMWVIASKKYARTKKRSFELDYLINKIPITVDKDSNDKLLLKAVLNRLKDQSIKKFPGLYLQCENFIQSIK